MAQAPHPRMHGLTHVAGGSDPVPFLPTGAGSYTDRVIAEPSLLAYWPLSDTGIPCADVSGNNKPLTASAGTPTFLQPGPLPASSYPYAVALNGGFGIGGSAESLRRFDEPDDTADNYFGFATGDPFTLEMYVLANDWPTTGFPTIAMLTLGSDTATAIALYSFAGEYDQYGEVFCKGVQTTGVTLNQNTWVHVAATFDGTTSRIYFDAAIIASGAGDGSQTGSADRVEVGGLYFSGSGQRASWNGSVAHVAVYNQALTQGQLASHLDGVDVPPGGLGAPGEVLAVGDDGAPTWKPPGVTVEHGDGPPDPAPAVKSSSPYAGGDTSSSGWHLQAHQETAVLYDSSSGRFDVPSMKWVRVPFNTVRILRAWEPVVGGPDLQEAWLPEDRGLTPQAENGILHIAAGMEGTADPIDGSHQSVGSWAWSPEMPNVDWRKLPNSPVSPPGIDPSMPDAYTRGARIVDLSHGFVLRASPGSSLRRFFEWDMWFPADATPDWVDYSSDNPYPIYPVWPERPLLLPPPYPKLTEAQSRHAYAPMKTFVMNASLTVGSNLCAQAWQDAPWLLRFSTDTYRMPYPNLKPDYIKRPHLAITYLYDPETIDHTTGKLL